MSSASVSAKSRMTAVFVTLTEQAGTASRGSTARRDTETGADGGVVGGNCGRHAAIAQADICLAFSAERRFALTSCSISLLSLPSSLSQLPRPSSTFCASF